MNSVNDGVARSIRQWLRQFPVLVAVKRWAFPSPQPAPPSQISTINLVESLPLYVPFSAGTYEDVAAATIQTANSLFPVFGDLLKQIGKDAPGVMNAEDFPTTEAERESAKTLKPLLDSYGSDKASPHNYHYLYGPILADRNNIRAVLEIGLGTNHTDVMSHMGVDGKPGASLRAFRDFLPNARIVGADVDKRILFQEERIVTHYVDQTNPTTLHRLSEATPYEFDLIIDDGLHSPSANIAVLAFAVQKVRIGGWIVIEDISDMALPVWNVVAALLPGWFRCWVIRIEGANAFVVQRTT